MFINMGEISLSRGRKSSYVSKIPDPNRIASLDLMCHHRPVTYRSTDLFQLEYSWRTRLHQFRVHNTVTRQPCTVRCSADTRHACAHHLSPPALAQYPWLFPGLCPSFLWPIHSVPGTLDLPLPLNFYIWAKSYISPLPSQLKTNYVF